MIAFYGRTLKFVLRFQTITLLVALGTLLLTVFLVYRHPERILSRSRYRNYPGHFAGASIHRQSGQWPISSRKSLTTILQDPAVESLSSFIGADGTNITTNSGRLSINLKPLENRNLNASDVIRRLQTNSTMCKAYNCSCSRCRTSRWTIASAARSINTHWKTLIRTN